MTDAEKLKLIDNIIADAYEFIVADERKEGYFEGVLIGIGDEYELPIFIADTVKEMAEISGLTVSTINTHIYLNGHRKRKHRSRHTFIRVVI